MSYNKITLFPNVKYDYVVLKDNLPTQDVIDYFDNPFCVPDWEDAYHTIIIANFNNDLVSSVINDLGSPLTSWMIYRQKHGDSRQYFVAQVDKNQLNIIDYLCENQSEYNYFIIPVTENTLGISLESNKVSTDWWGYSITGLKEIAEGIYTPEQVWVFDLDLNSTDITQNTDVTTFKTFTRTPKLSIGESNYQTMGISCLLGKIDNLTERYNDSIDLLKSWQDFVASGSLCLWKDRKGSMKIGHITANPTFKYQDELVEQNTTISFNFIETKDIKDISVYGVDNKTYSAFENINKNNK